MIRLKSLDIMRGLTVALMILVNNGGEQNYHILTHSKWNGLTPCDLVFPFFLFMMGMSTYLSLRKTEFKPSLITYRKIAKRTILLFLIGLSINWFDMICSGNGLDFAHSPLLWHCIPIGHPYQPTVFCPYHPRHHHSLYGHLSFRQRLCLRCISQHHRPGRSPFLRLRSPLS